ncbi:MAG TPA: thioredoxin domain-containing protein [Kofleriaceae bacterium]|nr:thioredoxin domain-containing protein [Kofleriaceae bacterium]
MNKLVFVALAAVGSLVGCQSADQNIEKKLDDILAMKKDIADIKAAIAKGGIGAGAQAQRPQRREPDRAKTYAVPIEGDAFDGPADAKVTLIKAYDYACPYCEKVRPTMEELRQKYGNDLRIVSKQMVVHPNNAMAGALAFCAANLQGKAKQMDALVWDKGFKVRNLDNSTVAAAPPAAMAEKGGAAAPPANQKCWDTAEGCKNVVGYAQELGLNVEQFKADMKGKCEQLVQKDMSDLQKLGVGATPSFFINGRFLSGAMPIENFSALIDEELKKANERVQQGTPAAQYYNQWVLAKGEKSI